MAERPSRVSCRKNAGHKAGQAHRGHRRGLYLFTVTMGLAVLHFLGVGHADDRLPLICGATWITFFAIILPAWGAAVHAIMNQLEFERIATRSERMAKALKVVAERCERAPSLAALRQAIREGEQVIGIENHEWWVLLSFRRPMLPV